MSPRPGATTDQDVVRASGSRKPSTPTMVQLSKPLLFVVQFPPKSQPPASQLLILALQFPLINQTRSAEAGCMDHRRQLVDSDPLLRSLRGASQQLDQFLPTRVPAF